MVGLPVIGMATTEMVSAVHNGVNGFVDTDIDNVIEKMKELLNDADQARKLSAGARAYARERFSIERFARDWTTAFHLASENYLTPTSM